MEDKRNDELSEEELMNFYGGFQLNSENPHPFEDTQLYGENQKEKLKELKEQLLQNEENSLTRSGRR